MQGQQKKHRYILKVETNVIVSYFIVLSLISIFAVLSACSGPGTVYVSHPQVNTRERLVEERHREYQWLKDQLDKSDEITTTYQGLRDFREFTGFFNELKGSFNPTQVKLNALENEAEKSAIQTKIWQNRATEEKARKEYEALQSQPVGSPTPTVPQSPTVVPPMVITSAAKEIPPNDKQTTNDKKDDTKTEDKDATSKEDPEEAEPDKEPKKAPTSADNRAKLPTPTIPFGQKPEELILPDPNQIQETKAKAHPLDLLHDKLAYRNAVNTAIRSVQLDDSHDLAGRMLYEMTLQIAMTAGENTDEHFAQVKLEVLPEKLDKDRARELASLYEGWVEALKFDLNADITQLQNRVQNGQLKEQDLDYLGWFATRLGPYLLVEMNKRTEESIEETFDEGKSDENFWNKLMLQQGRYDFISEDLKKENGNDGNQGNNNQMKSFNLGSGQQTTSKKNSPPSLTEKENSYAKAEAPLTNDQYRKLKDLVQEFRKLNFKDMRKPGVNEKKMLRKAAAWTIWGSHVVALDPIIGIKAPDLDDEGWLNKGLEEIKRLSIEKTCTMRNKQKCEEKPKLSKFLPDKISQGNDVFNRAFGNSTGVARFIESLTGLEQDPHVPAVLPKEHAQNVSEAAAREEMLNLVFALSAALPQFGVDAENRTQYVKRAQTYLHAITRQPLLVGYGNGNHEFGWFLGPAFRVDDGVASFQHRTIRHDVSASLVVPSWWTRAKISGKYGWVNKSGQPPNDEKWINLWDKPVKVTLRMPENANKQITAALVRQSIVSEPYLHTTRPWPVIHHPERDPSNKEEPPSIILQAYPLNLPTQPAPQQVLILGENLWRTPQVLIGSQKADHVEVLSNMGGVLATFDELLFPGTLEGPNAPSFVDVDLTMLTTFGHARGRKAVRILRPVQLPVTRDPPVRARLLRHFTDDESTKLTFAFPQPDSFASIYLMSRVDSQQGDFTQLETDTAWDFEGQHVSFDVGKAEGSPEAIEADLLLRPKKNVSTGTHSILENPITFVKFMDKKQRSFMLNHKAEAVFTYNPDTNTFDNDLILSLSTKFEENFNQAYPGLENTIARKGLTLQFRRAGEEITSFIFESSDVLNATEEMREYKADGSALAAVLKDHLGEQKMNLRVTYINKHGTKQYVPVYSNDDDGKLATLIFKKTDPTVDPPDQEEESSSESSERNEIEN